MKNIFFALILLVGFVFACSKDRLSPLHEEELPGTGLKPSNLIENPEIPLAFIKPEEKVTISSWSDLPFKTKNGTTINLNSYHFNRLSNGKDVTYPYQLIVTELLTIKDIILHEKQTVSNNRLLSTDGQILIQAFKDGEALTLANGATPEINMPGMKKPITDPKMRIFYGDENKSGFNWIPDSSECRERQGMPGCLNIAGIKDIYRMFPSKIGWINIDRFAEYSNTTFIKFESEVDLKYIKTFLFFPDINSVLQVNYKKEFPVPVGFKAKVISFAFTEDDKVYAFHKDIVIQANQVIKIVLFETTKEEVMKELEKL